MEEKPGTSRCHKKLGQWLILGVTQFSGLVFIFSDIWAWVRRVRHRLEGKKGGEEERPRQYSCYQWLGGGLVNMRFCRAWRVFPSAGGELRAEGANADNIYVFFNRLFRQRVIRYPSFPVFFGSIIRLLFELDNFVFPLYLSQNLVVCLTFC